MRIILFILLLFTFFLSPRLYAQDKGYLEFSGRTIKNYKPLSNAQITIFSGNMKIVEVTTGRNGKFMFDLELGNDYKIVFNARGCVEMFVTINASACPSSKLIYPIYEIDVNFFELNQTMVNYELFKQPIAKVIYDGNKRFVDEEGYIEQFMKSIFIDPDELRRKKELEEEKVRLQREEDLIVKNKLKEEEARLLKEQQLFAEKKAVQEAEIMKKIVAEKIKSTHKKESSKNRELNFNETRSKLREDEVYLKISFEKKKITENQNKIIKKNVETNLLKSFAENERVKIRSKSTFQKVNETPDNPVIELLKREALAKATSSDLMLEVKLKNKQILLNQGIMHQELMRNMKTAVKTEKDNAFQSNKSQKNLKRKGVIGITTDLEKRTFKTIYMITLVSNGSKTNYKKETYTWGLSYYYKNNEPINEQTYYSELSFYDVPL